MTGRFRIQAGRLLFQVRLTPKGGRDAIEGWASTADGKAHLKARVRATPQDGAANLALVALLAKELGVARAALTLEAGAKARLKSLSVVGDTAALSERLNGWGP